jgi:L-threonylcarbamoyladenylate synthase
LILKRRTSSPLSADVNPGGDTVSLRVPGNDITRALIAAAARPLTAPSANPSGAPSPRTAQAVVDGLGSALAMVVDGGESLDDIGSTVLIFENGDARILREGAVARAEIERVLEAPVR